MTAVSTAGRVQPRATADRVRWVLRGFGQLLITLGVVIVLFTLYELKITGLYTEHQQSVVSKALDKTWAAAPPPTATAPLPYVAGDGIARIYFPSLGKVHFTVVEGTSREDLKKGPGHFEGTARPGGLGNVVISGHRTTYLAPFNRVDELHPGDDVVLETQTYWYTYRVTGLSVVAPDAIEVTYPVPGQLHGTPRQRLLTLTTCNPKYSARTRLIVRGVLEAPLAKRPGVLPPALLGRT